MRGDLEPLAARLASDVIIDTDEMVFDLVKKRAVTGVGAGWNLRLFGAAHPPERVVVGAAAPRALEASGPLLWFFGEKLAFVHVRSVHQD
jgi:hypothetical protein